jgi:hypothetical protein
MVTLKNNEFPFENSSQRSFGMGFFDRLFGRGAKPSKSDLPTEMEAVFEKIRNFIMNEATQNNGYPPELQQMMTVGGAIDEIAGAVGEFGRDIRNPIPVNGPIGELVYISMIALPGGCAIMGHRLGSINKLDVFETMSLDGSMWDILFFDMYHTRKSKRLPIGYQVSSQPFLLATNVMVPAFPCGMYKEMSELTERVIGIALVSPKLRDETLFQGFSRPPGHLLKIKALRPQSRADA